MRWIISFVSILCLIQCQVEASDWLNRTIQVNLIVPANRRAFDANYDVLEQSETILSDWVNATNGQYPWTIYTTAWSSIRVGTGCTGTIISDTIVLSDLHCTREKCV